MLETSWFTLCLPGFTGTTNRVLEAVCRGSIPVLPAETANFYDLALEHDKNCVLVQPGAWPRAIETIAGADLAWRTEKRRAVIALASSVASPALLHRRIATRLIQP